ncbi:hypothetical protein IPA_00215 [Ignicoccus pacificus DSM 13166]|uniref:Cren protein n=1 Tax=Ignicoccus pacificus DSM 13166 TaxID=940294 RepID=A0A977PJQ3_9CREN|nr:hypothetical protein IPA_00215 [Ignicoccus pacificus DSM 13166]
MEREELKRAKLIKVKDVESLARLVATYLVLGKGAYILRFEAKGKHFCGVLSVLKDYYKYYGIPLFYYTTCEDKGKYLILKKGEKGEELSYSDHVISNAVCVPIIDLQEVPFFIEVEEL